MSLKPRLGLWLTVVLILLLEPRAVCGSGCPGSFQQSPGPDVIVGEISDITNYPAVGNLEALTLGTTSCNLGDQQLMWNGCPSNTHPVIGGNLYKWFTVNGVTRFEQVGQSWLKHGFGASQGQVCCATCQPSIHRWFLGVGCSDPYCCGINGVQSSLGPKYLVSAHTGYYPEDCPPTPWGGNTGRLEVEIADLVVTAGGPGAAVRYFGQSHYVTPDDAAVRNQDNNASYREATASESGGDWTFNLIGVTQREIPAIRVWRTIDSDIVETDVRVPEDDDLAALVIMAAKTTDLGNGNWHYEYAVNNLNSDRSIGSFAVPVGIYATVQNVGFHGVTYRGGDGLDGQNYDGTDWSASVSGGMITWATTPYDINANANALRWGTLYNFRFDADSPPAAGDVALGQFTYSNFVNAASVIPAIITCQPGDLNGDGRVDGADISVFCQLLVSGGGSGRQRCSGDLQQPPDGIVDEADVAPFVQCVLAPCSSPSRRFL